MYIKKCNIFSNSVKKGLLTWYSNLSWQDTILPYTPNALQPLRAILCGLIHLPHMQQRISQKSLSSLSLYWSGWCVEAGSLYSVVPDCWSQSSGRLLSLGLMTTPWGSSPHGPEIIKPRSRPPSPSQLSIHVLRTLKYARTSYPHMRRLWWYLCHVAGIQKACLWMSAAKLLFWCFNL